MFGVGGVEAVGSGGVGEGEKKESTVPALSGEYTAGDTAETGQDRETEVVPSVDLVAASEKSLGKRAADSSPIGQESTSKAVETPEVDLAGEEEAAEEVNLTADKPLEGEGQLAKLSRLPGGQAKLDEFFPVLDGESKAVWGTAEEKCSEAVQVASEGLYQQATQVSLIHLFIMRLTNADTSFPTKPKRLNKDFAAFVKETGSETIHKWTMESLTEPFKNFVGSEVWTREKLEGLATSDLTLQENGCYVILCGPYAYGGSTGNFEYRIMVHEDEIRFNRNGDPYAEKKLFYEQCKSVPDEKPRYIYVAVNKHPEVGRFVEVMESIIIAILDLFDTGRLTPYARQVNLTKGLRLSSLPQRDWIAGNASLPVCMGYQPKLSPEMREAIRQRVKAMAEALSEERVRSEALGLALKREKKSLNKYTWCDTCGVPLEAHHWSDHVKTRSHRRACRPEKSFSTRKIVMSAVRKISWHDLGTSMFSALGIRTPWHRLNGITRRTDGVSTVRTGLSLPLFTHTRSPRAIVERWKRPE